jgi:hypothetical protein
MSKALFPQTFQLLFLTFSCTHLDTDKFMSRPSYIVIQTTSSEFEKGLLEGQIFMVYDLDGGTLFGPPLRALG